MRDYKNRKGLDGEERAASYLIEKGYEILERRFRSEAGEVDIVAKKGENLVFVEVKTWDYLDAESLERSVDSHKRARIREAAALFLQSRPEFGNSRIRFDLVFLSRRMKKLEHWTHAF